jgi:hypothetical protein
MMRPWEIAGEILMGVALLIWVAFVLLVFAQLTA